MTMKAPVGPPICTRLPPSAEIRKPATTAVNSPTAGGEMPADLATSGGIEAIYELDLNTDEQAMLNESAGAVREVVGLLTS